MSKKVVIAGGSGFVGKALVAEFAGAGYEVVVLSRSSKAVEGARVVQWDGATLGAWTKELEGADGVINLCGVPVSKLWTEKYRKELRDSRVIPTALIAQAIHGMAEANAPRCWVNVSGIGFYGDTKDVAVSESHPAGKDFLGELSVAWEGAVDAHPTPATRKAILRLGVVLGHGGAMEVLVKLTKSFLGSAIGNGKQWMSWVHVTDVARMFRWVVEGDAKGPINCVSPEPITNSDFMAALRARFGRPFVPPPPMPILRIAGQVMGTQVDLLLISNKVFPTLAEAQGFRFSYPTLASAFDDLLTDLPKAWQ